MVHIIFCSSHVQTAAISLSTCTVELNNLSDKNIRRFPRYVKESFYSGLVHPCTKQPGSFSPKPIVQMGASFILPLYI